MDMIKAWSGKKQPRITLVWTFGLFDNRITGSLDIYKRQTKDLLNTIPVPAGTNFTDRLLTNVGDLENNGFEFFCECNTRFHKRP